MLVLPLPVTLGTPLFRAGRPAVALVAVQFRVNMEGQCLTRAAQARLCSTGCRALGGLDISFPLI